MGRSGGRRHRRVLIFALVLAIVGFRPAEGSAEGSGWEDSGRGEAEEGKCSEQGMDATTAATMDDGYGDVLVRPPP